MKKQNFLLFLTIMTTSSTVLFAKPKKKPQPTLPASRPLNANAAPFQPRSIQATAAALAAVVATTQQPRTPTPSPVLLSTPISTAITEFPQIPQSAPNPQTTLQQHVDSFKKAQHFTEFDWGNHSWEEVEREVPTSRIVPHTETLYFPRVWRNSSCLSQQPWYLSDRFKDHND